MPDRLSRADAVLAGSLRYCTGAACPHGHVGERFVSTRACVQCATEKSAAWKRDNPEKHAAQHRQWMKANPEAAKVAKLAEQKRNRAGANVRNRRYRAANLELCRERSAAWGAKNPGKCTAKAARHRAAKHIAPWADHELMAAYYELARCYRDVGIAVEVDHVVPLQGEAVCGLHVHDNLQVIPLVMNRAKSNHFAAH